MKLNHKFQLNDEEAQNISSLKTRMNNVLNDSVMGENEKAAIYQDLTARMRNYRSEIDVPVTMRLEQKPEESELSYMIGNTPVKFKGVQTNKLNEMVLNGRVYPGSNVVKVLNYLYGKTKTIPGGYSDFMNHLTSISDRRFDTRIAHPQNQTPKATVDDENDKDMFNTPGTSFSTPQAVYKIKTPVKPRKSMRLQQGHGEKRLYIKMWDL